MKVNEFEIDPAAGSLSYAVLRICLGVNIAMHGISRLLSGPDMFTAGLVKQFHETFLPIWSVQAFGYGLPYIESTIGLLILVGFWTRGALIAGGLVMAVLTFGTCLLQQWEIAGTQLLYSLAFAFLLLLNHYDAWSVDSIVNRNQDS